MTYQQLSSVNLDASNFVYVMDNQKRIDNELQELNKKVAKPPEVTVDPKFIKGIIAEYMKETKMEESLEAIKKTIEEAFNKAKVNPTQIQSRQPPPRLLDQPDTGSGFVVADDDYENFLQKCELYLPRNVIIEWKKIQATHKFNGDILDFIRVCVEDFLKARIKQ